MENLNTGQAVLKSLKAQGFREVAQGVKDYFLCLFSKRIVFKSEPEVHFYRKLRYAREE